MYNRKSAQLQKWKKCRCAKLEKCPIAHGHICNSPKLKILETTQSKEYTITKQKNIENKNYKIAELQNCNI